MILKAFNTYLKGLLFGIIVFFSVLSQAQPTKKLVTDTTAQTAISEDSAKLQAAIIDSLNKNNADTSFSSLLKKLEAQANQLNKDLTRLRRGFDTVEVSEEIPLIEDGLNKLQAGLDKMKSGAYIRNLNSIKVALQQVLKLAKKHQETLNGYSETLNKISKNQAKIATDQYLSKMPGDSILRLSYLLKLNPLLQKSKTNDSLLYRYTKTIGLLQTSISGTNIRCAEMLDDVNVKINIIQSNFLRRDAPFLWQATSSSDGSTLAEDLKLGLSRNTIISLYYLSLNAASMLIVLFLGIAFFILNKVSVYKLRKSDNANWDQPLNFLKNKIWLPTILVVFTLMPFSMLNPPAGLVQLFWFIMMITATLIRWKDWPLAFRRMWIGIIVFFILFSMDSFLPEATYAERGLLTIFNLTAVALGWLMYREVLKDKTRYHALMDKSLLLFLIFNLIAFFSNLTGRINIARILSNSATLSITLLLALQIIREVLMELLYLQVEAYKHISSAGFTAFNKMKETFRTVLGVVTILLWLLALSWSLNLYDTINENIGNFLIQKRSVAKFSFSLSGVLIFVGIIWVSMLAGKLVTFIFHGDESDVVGSRTNKSGSLMLFTKLGIYTIGVLLAFAATGIGMDKFAIVIGALGVGIGFGLQNIVNNLVSGIILAIEKPMEIGDVVELGTKVGTVKEIGFRSSKIATFEGSVVIVPNGDFISQQLINWTHSNNNYRRVEIIVGIKYGTNLDKVKKIIDAIIMGNKDVAKYPAPNILVNEFANSSVNIRILFWTADYDKWVVLKSKINQEIYESFAENGIEIPFPQTDLHLKSIDPEVAEILKGKKRE